MKRNWIRKILRGLSLTSAMFIFQACYGTPQDFGLDSLVEGQVKSQKSGLPIKGIKVSIGSQIQYDITNEDGHFSLYTDMMENLRIKFQDADSTENGQYEDRDTLLKSISNKVFLDITLMEK